uniref:Alanine--glyoxylate aminotransferase 2, mitochondrial n=1 Tax=Macrostomum lignano TaxID=282301 RepID=A0A1I8FF83_9PLAT
SSSYEENLRQRRELLSPGLISYYANRAVHSSRQQAMAVGSYRSEIPGHLWQPQSEQLWHTTSIYMSPAPQAYAKKLTAKLPPELSVCYFTNSGSEANDLAVLMARLYTRRWEVVTLRNGYHGASPFLMGATALSTWRYATPTGFGFVNAAHPDPYRGEWAAPPAETQTPSLELRLSAVRPMLGAASKYVAQLEDTLRFSCPKAGPAAFLAESIQGVGGIVQFRAAYSARRSRAVRAAGGLVHLRRGADGLRRLGSHYWGLRSSRSGAGHCHHGQEHRERVPAGRGGHLAGGGPHPWAEALHFNTFGGNPLACAVGTAVLDVIDEEKLQENCQRVGQRLLSGLQRLRQSNQLIGDVRGKGLMVGVELVADRASRAAAGGAKDGAGCSRPPGRRGAGWQGRFLGNVLRLQPPMCVTEADADATGGSDRRGY